jgi:polar amino acid transport system substrate-binding protein
MRIPVAHFLGLVLLCAQGSALAAPLVVRMCTDEAPRPPHTTPKGDGIVDQLIRQAASEAGVQLEYFPAPLARCQQEILSGRADGFPSAPAAKSLLRQGQAAFPTKAGKPDRSRAVSIMRSIVYRRIGSDVGWDGKKFTNLKTAALVPSTSILMIERLQAVGVKVDANSKTQEANFAKLVAGRADIALGLEPVGAALLAHPEYSSRIEALPVAFTEEPYYFVVGMQFYKKHTQLVETIWANIARIRHSPAYQAALREAFATRSLRTRMRMCTEEQPRPPHIMPDGSGTVDLLIQMAAREADVEIQLYGAPLKRCREEIRNNIGHAFPTTPYSPALLDFMDFPMLNGAPDPARAVSNFRAMVFRRAGSNVQWDGKHFSGLHTPALIPTGSVLLNDRMASMKIPFDASGKTLEVNFTKLVAGRSDVAIGSELNGIDLMADPRFAGKVEMLPVAFSDEAYYLAVSKPFHEANPDTTARLWAAIGRLRKSPAYIEAARKIAEGFKKGQ